MVEWHCPRVFRLAAVCSVFSRSPDCSLSVLGCYLMIFFSTSSVLEYGSTGLAYWSTGLEYGGTRPKYRPLVGTQVGVSVPGIEPRSPGFIEIGKAD